jgi:signal transduction histidine kinase
MVDSAPEPLVVSQPLRNSPLPPQAPGGLGWDAILENIPMPLVVGTLEEVPRLVFMNREYVRLFGYRPEEVPTIAEWMPLAYPDPVYRSEIIGWWLEMLSESLDRPGLVRSREVRVRAKDGRDVEAILNAMVLEAHVLVAFQDTTALRQRALELEKSATRRQLAADVAGVGFWEYDLATGAETQDAQIHRIYGVAEGGDFGCWEKRVHPEDLGAALRSIDGAVESGGHGQEMDFRIVRPDGAVRWIRSKSHIARDGGGRALRLTGIEFDITGDREIRVALEQALARSERENAEKSRFLASVSHEIRTPLSALVSLANSMLLEGEKHPLPEVYSQHLESVRAGGQYLNLILSNLLDLSAIEGGNTAMHCRDFYIGDWADDLAGILAPIAKARGVRMEWALPADPEARFRTDQVRLTQIVLNLAHNAVKFSINPNAVVSIAVSLEGGRLRVSVEDQGPGVDPARIDGLFGEYAQGSPVPRGADRGIGLGLAIVKKNVELLGGSVRAGLAEPTGMKFVVELPAVDAGGAA